MAVNNQDKPIRKPVPSLAERRAAKAHVADVIRSGLNDYARTEHGTLAELSRIAALATSRLDQAAGEQGNADRDLAAVKAMLQEIENAGHQAYLAKQGTEEDYEAIGSKVEKRYRTPSGKWRL